MLTVDWAMVIIGLVIVLGGWIISGGEVIGGVLVISIGYGMFVPLYINAKLILSTLYVDDEGVTAAAFGHAWKVHQMGRRKGRPFCTMDKPRF